MTMRGKIIVIIFVSVALSVGFVLWFGCKFAPGSYPYAEEYELNYPEERVKEAIKKFKRDNIEYIVPRVMVNGQGTWELLDERTKDPDLWFKFYFYYKKEDQILYTCIRPVNNQKTTFAFVSINQSLNLGNWKSINKDFSPSENKELKGKFEQRILNEIKKNLE